MNKTAQLVLSFAEFEERYPNASVEDFARHLLARGRPVKAAAAGVKGHSILAKLIGRIMRLNSHYANAALRAIDLGGLDEFTYLLSVSMLNNPTKTEVINQNFQELSSGLLIISRLKSKGLLSEKPDTEDKRSRRIMLTKKGQLKLAAAQVELSRVSHLFFGSIGDDDIQLCVSMLSPVEQEFAGRWALDKGKSFDEIVGGKKKAGKARD